MDTGRVKLRRRFVRHQKKNSLARQFVAVISVVALLSVVTVAALSPHRATIPRDLHHGAATLVIGKGTRGYVIPSALFGLGVDVNSASYAQPGDISCRPLSSVGPLGLGVVRIGADEADNYDWPTDTYIAGRHAPIHASFGCKGSQGPGASILRVLERTRALHATPVVVLNGESDDPQSAANLVRLIAAHMGLSFARQIYWEIGNNPQQWRYFGEPLHDRTLPVACLPDQYAALVSTYTAAIAAALPGTPRAPLIVADEWIVNATDQSWTGVVTAVDTHYFPFDSPLSQPGSAMAVARAISGGSGGLSLQGQNGHLSDLRASLNLYSGGQGVHLFVGEWNPDANQQPSTPFYGGAAQAVFVGNLLLSLMQSQADGVTMATWAPPLYTSPQSPFSDSAIPTPAFRVFAALRALAGGQILTAHLSGRDEGLTTMVARDSAGHIVALVINAQMHPLPLYLTQDRRATATLYRIAADTPNGLSRPQSLHSGATLLSLPALSVTILTLSR